LTVREEAGRLQLLTGKDSVDLIQRGGLEFSSAGKESIIFEAPSGGLSPAVRRGGKRFTRDNPDVRITPLRPIADLSREARAASPPPQKSDMFKPDLVELTRLDSSIKLDIRYATADNFMGAPFYSQPRAFLQRPAAQAVVRFHRFLKEHGLGLVIFDAYRPWYVTRMFWDATPPEKRNFVADPALGSRHNRGSAVDLTIYDSASGRALDMGGAYDEFSSRSFIDFPGGTALQRWNRQFLKAFMEQEGFTVFHDEWWHYDYKDRDRYPVLNLTFEQLH
jgi:D-alanyl-D-alanine dipeptidase